jgi:hypothetical protein
VVLDEGDGAAQFDRWATVLAAGAAVAADPALVGGRLCDGVPVCPEDLAVGAEVASRG